MIYGYVILVYGILIGILIKKYPPIKIRRLDNGDYFYRYEDEFTKTYLGEYGLCRGKNKEDALKRKYEYDNKMGYKKCEKKIIKKDIEWNIPYCGFIVWLICILIILIIV